MRQPLLVNGVIVGEVEVTGDVEKDIEACRNLMREKGVELPAISQAQQMFGSAFAFCTTANDLYKKGLSKTPTDPNCIIPFVVNSAFSIELYLKTLLHLEGSTVRSHALVDLYDALLEKTKDVLFRHAKIWSPKYGTAVDSTDAFRGFITELNTAFVDWRYCYETGKTGPVNFPSIIVVLAAAHESYMELKPKT